MSEKLDLTKILKNCPKGEKFYSTIYGEVEFEKIRKDSDYPIVLITKHGNNCDVLSDGKHYGQYDGECTLFPSKDQRDWSKFTAPWLKKDKFGPKTLQAFDKVIVRDATYKNWKCDFFFHIYLNLLRIVHIDALEIFICFVFHTMMKQNTLWVQQIKHQSIIDIGRSRDGYIIDVSRFYSHVFSSFAI